MNKFKYAPLLIMLCSHASHADTVSSIQLANANEYVQAEMQKRHEIIAGRFLPYPTIIQNDIKFKHELAAMAHEPIGNVNAAYYYGSLYLHENFTKDDTPYLIHELVHHYQAGFAINYECENAKEREAYEIQNKYAVSYDLSNRIVSEQFINKLSKCE